MTGMLHILPHILDPVWKLRSLRKLDKGININPKDKTSYTTQYQETVLIYVENEYYAKHHHLPDTNRESIRTNNLVTTAMALDLVHRRIIHILCLAMTMNT
jgi:hypothetical protein